MCTRIYEPLTVLLVEDTEDDLHLALRAFRKCELPLLVKVARDGREALQLLGIDGDADAGTIPDLVICDMKLPLLNGHEVLARIRADSGTAQVPVVMFSSSDERPDVRTSYKLGANSYVQKPVDYQEFVDTVCEMVTYWLVTNRPDRAEFCEFQPATEALQ